MSELIRIDEILAEASQYFIRGEVTVLSTVFKLIHPHKANSDCYNDAFLYLMKLHGIQEIIE